MEGQPEHFEAIGSRLGFRVAEDGPRRLKLEWRGPRFPAFLCLGIASALLFLSVPIVEAIRVRGFVGPAGSLWYFPLMNVVLLGISLFLLSLKRTIVFDHEARTVTFTKRSLLATRRFSRGYHEVEKLRLGIDAVYSGFAIAGSSAAENFPVPSLRLELAGGKTVLIDRGGVKRLRPFANRLSAVLNKTVDIDPRL